MSPSQSKNTLPPDTTAHNNDLNTVRVTEGWESGMLENIPDGTVLFLNDILPDALGDVLVASLQDSPVHIISSTPPLSSGELAPTSVDSKTMKYVQFEDMRLLSETEFSVLLYDHG